MDLYRRSTSAAGAACGSTRATSTARPSTATIRSAQALAFAAAGAPWIHVVDLDAARTGEPVNRPVVAAIAGAVSVPVQTGGGVRDEAAAEALLGPAWRRVVLGTAALEHPELVRRAGRRVPGRSRRPRRPRPRGAVRGLGAGRGRDLLDVAPEFADAGVAAVVVTEIERDGTLAGPTSTAWPPCSGHLDRR